MHLGLLNWASCPSAGGVSSFGQHHPSLPGPWEPRLLLCVCEFCCHCPHARSRGLVFLCLHMRSSRFSHVVADDRRPVRFSTKPCPTVNRRAFPSPVGHSAHLGQPCAQSLWAVNSGKPPSSHMGVPLLLHVSPSGAWDPVRDVLGAEQAPGVPPRCPGCSDHSAQGSPTSTSCCLASCLLGDDPSAR